MDRPVTIEDANLLHHFAEGFLPIGRNAFVMDIKEAAEKNTQEKREKPITVRNALSKNPPTLEDFKILQSRVVKVIPKGSILTLIQSYIAHHGGMNKSDAAKELERQIKQNHYKMDVGLLPRKIKPAKIRTEAHFHGSNATNRT
eukprot:scaffold367_cov274-Ochromonas_danica.AAC.9